MPDQPRLTRLRLAALGGDHCEEKGCSAPACLNHAVALHLGGAGAPDIAGTPPGCLLRRHSPGELGALAVTQGPAA
jgi:hypothetical protein